MIKKDYSKNAGLLDVEVLDYDTKLHNETGINSTRMRLPTRYDISKFYKRFKKLNAFGKNEKGRWVEKENPIDFSEDFDWQITYAFPNTIRDNTTDSGAEYGGRHVTYRRLYLILCERFNDGNYFIDDYFDTVYPYTIKPEVDARLDEAKEYLLGQASDMLEGAVATRKGTLHKRRKANKGMEQKLLDYKSFAETWENKEGEYLAKLIKADIISCMTSGQLQARCISHINDIDTTRERIQKGLQPYPVFVATHRLIEHIQLYVKIGGNGKWKTRQGILV